MRLISANYIKYSYQESPAKIMLLPSPDLLEDAASDAIDEYCSIHFSKTQKKIFLGGHFSVYCFYLK
jgi:hypothetical protein